MSAAVVAEVLVVIIVSYTLLFPAVYIPYAVLPVVFITVPLIMFDCPDASVNPIPWQLVHVVVIMLLVMLVVLTLLYKNMPIPIEKPDEAVDVIMLLLMVFADVVLM